MTAAAGGASAARAAATSGAPTHGGAAARESAAAIDIDVDEPIVVALPVAAAARPAVAAVDDDAEARFRPPPVASQELELEAAAPRAPASAAPSEAEVRLRPRCPEHDVPLEDGACPECIDEAKPVPGRLMRGALRRKPMVRLGAGLALGLLAGYLASAPYASRAERRVAELRAAANLDRYRPTEEARLNTRRLDADASSAANRAFAGTIAIWLVIAGGVIAGWYRVT